jgi:hypothetical protein
MLVARDGLARLREAAAAVTAFEQSPSSDVSNELGRAIEAVRGRLSEHRCADRRSWLARQYFTVAERPLPLTVMVT